MPAGEIMELLPGTRVMMLTASTEEDAVIEAIAAGATGYLQKYSRPEELVGAVVDVAEGRLRIPEESVRQVFAMIRGERGLASRQNRHKLTALERRRWRCSPAAGPTPRSPRRGATAQ